MKKSVGVLISAVLASALMAGAGELDLSVPPSDGMVVEKGFSGTPDADGLLVKDSLKLPTFEKGLVFIETQQEGLPYRSGNRIYGKAFGPGPVEPEPNALGQLMVLKLKTGAYRAILPLIGEASMSWIRTDAAGNWMLVHGSLGTEAVAGDLPLVAVADDANPYLAVSKVWKKGLSLIPAGVRARFREEKVYPEVFRNLGWCSWEAYKRNVSEELLLGIIKDYKASGLPVKYMLIDGGHWSFEKGVGPRVDTFPNGYRKIVGAMDGQPFKWVGLHYQSFGFSDGIQPAPGNDLGEYNQYVTAVKSTKHDRIIPKDTPEANRKWWDYMTGFALKDGVSFVKIDFLKDPLLLNAGLWGTTERQGNAVRAASRYAMAMEESLHRNRLGLMNCNGNNWPMPFYARYSCSTRCSEDYKKNSFESAREHTYNSYSTILMLGHLHWGDHDMFHSSDQFAGELMAVCKAMSGGPVYFSDKPADVKPENIYPLCYRDGSLPRPLAPGLISEDSLFFDIDSPGGELLKVFAPLANGSVALHIINLNQEPGAAGAAISGRDYENAGSMMQPYPGPWKIPAEGLVLFDVLAGKGHLFSGRETVTLEKPLSHQLLQLSPVNNGWALIGRTDKYLCAATGEVLSSSKKELHISLVEPGPFAVYSAGGQPAAKGLEFKDIGNGFYKATAPEGVKEMVIRR
jgi:hypothetical protein